MEPRRSGGVCRKFANGFCRFGPNCIYRHELPVLLPSHICRYFQKGACWYGDTCRYVHTMLPDTDVGRRGSVPTVSSSLVTPVPLGRRRSEPSFLQTEVGARQNGNSETIRNTSSTHHTGRLTAANSVGRQDQEVQSDSTLGSGLALPGANGEDEKETSSERLKDDSAACPEAATSATQNVDDTQEAFLLSNTITCGICMDRVYEKPNPRSHYFGILPNCNHSYCLQCIRTWRKTKDFGPDVVKTCPQCRVSSPFYVPNPHWVEGPAKEKLIAAFKEQSGRKSCEFYARSGSCPFKTDCLHRHDQHRGHRPLLCLDVDEDEDYLTVNLVRFFITMALLGAEDDDIELITSLQSSL